jgi:hypothetical protein
MPITREQLNLAGWCSVISAVVTIPIVVISLILAEDEDIVSQTVVISLTLIGNGLFVYEFVVFKKLLNFHFGFGDADTLISVLIWANIIGSVISLLPLSEGGVTMTGLALIPFGIIFIVFAIKLLRLPDNLFGLLKPFSYTSIATGFCFATIFLIPLGLVTSTIADIILAIIFFRFVGKVEMAAR